VLGGEGVRFGKAAPEQAAQDHFGPTSRDSVCSPQFLLSIVLAFHQFLSYLSYSNHPTNFYINLNIPPKKKPQQTQGTISPKTSSNFIDDLKNVVRIVGWSAFGPGAWDMDQARHSLRRT